MHWITNPVWINDKNQKDSYSYLFLNCVELFVGLWKACITDTRKSLFTKFGLTVL